MSPAKAQYHRCGGFNLIEVLVALVVLSIGILGLANLQMVGLKYSASAVQRLEAINQANDILERLRANPSQALAGDYNLEIGKSPSSHGLAQSDLEEWKATLAAVLPYGDGSILVKERTVTITVQWLESWDASRTDGLASVYLRTQI